MISSPGAFVPFPLPPDPALALHGPLQRKLETATFAIGRPEPEGAALDPTKENGTTESLRQLLRSTRAVIRDGQCLRLPSGG